MGKEAKIIFVFIKIFFYSIISLGEQSNVSRDTHLIHFRRRKKMNTEYFVK